MKFRQRIFLLAVYIYFMYSAWTPQFSCKMLIRETINKGANFTKLIYTKDTGYLYAAGVNLILQIKTEDMSIVAQVNTGPKLFSVLCLDQTNNNSCQCDWQPYPPGYNRTNCFPRKTDAKVLAWYAHDNKLYVCYNLFHGNCEKRHLSNITQTITLKKPRVTVVDSNPKSESVIFVNDNYIYLAVQLNAAYRTIPRDIAPLVILNKDFIIYKKEENVIAKSKLEIVLDPTIAYNMKFKTIFSYKPRIEPSSQHGYVYYVAVQPIHDGSAEYVTKMIRICDADLEFASYVEIPLECITVQKGWKDKYKVLRSLSVGKVGSDVAEALGIELDGDVLIASFDSPDLTKSALCMYSMKEVDLKFHQAVINCGKGIGLRGPLYYNGLPQQQGSCFPETINYMNRAYCPRSYPYNWPIMQQKAINSVAFYTTSSAVNSLAMTSVASRSTVIALASDNGNFYKVNVRVDQRANAREISAVDLSQINVSSHPLTDVKLHGNGETAFVSAYDKIVSVRMAACSHYTDCESCTAARDPYCGWCVIKGMCTYKTDCQSESYWLNDNTVQNKCPSILSVKPPGIQYEGDQVEKSVELQITLENMKSKMLTHNSRITCAFYTEQQTLILETTAVGDSSSIRCDTPTLGQMPPLLAGQQSLQIPLSIQVNSHKLVSGNIHIYDCAFHSNCGSCTSGAFGCMWCPFVNQCLEETAECNSYYSSKVTETQKCPQFAKLEHQVVRGPAGSDIEVVMRITNVGNNRISCGETCTNKTVQALPISNDNTFKCSFPKFSPAKMTAKKNCDLFAYWGEAIEPRYLLNKDNLSIEIFDCAQMASYCDTCQRLNPIYNCSWCPNKNQCLNKILDKSCTKWVDKAEICTNALIEKIIPANSTERGRPQISIYGRNLGRSIDNIHQVQILSLGDRVLGLCQPETYSSLENRFSCQLSKLKQVNYPPYRALLSVMIADKSGRIVSTATIDFFIMRPVMESLSPMKGPLDGGTLLTITGQYLNIGASQQVVLESPDNGQKLECKITLKTNDMIQCRTTNDKTATLYRYRRSSSDDQLIYHISLKIDSEEIPQKSLVFAYVDNPRVHSVSRSNFIKGGGLQIDVTGINFDSIQNPKIQIFFQNEKFTSECFHVLDTKLRCPSPVMNVSHLDLPPNSEMSMKYSFEMDDVAAVTTLKDCIVFPDPIVKRFPNGRKETVIQPTSSNPEQQSPGVLPRKSRPPVELTIYAEYLNDKVFDKEDINVTLNGHPVTIKSFTKDLLICEISDVSLYQNDVYYPLSVSIGYLTYDVGKMKLVKSGGPLTKEWIIIIAVVVVVVLTVVIVSVVCIHKVKAQNSKKREQGLQGQLQDLERNVANKCKAAFAEYVTEFTNFAQDVGFGHSNIPFRNYQEFSFLFLFPDHKGELDQHPVLSTFKVSLQSKTDVEQGLQHLSELILNKSFLMTMIEVMEENEQFTVHHKVKVASFLSVVLQHKMDYFTDILKCLIEDMIKRYKQDNKNPKLFLRRSESVAEKLVSYWFAFLLHSTLEARFGEPLFMLYRAILQRLNMGPVDFYTGDSYYALSTEKLIRNDKLDFKKIKLDVSNRTGEFEFNENLEVSVFDVDCITQVKEKILDIIYKGKPYKHRELVEDLDLYLINEYESNNQESSDLLNQSEKLLQDMDNSTDLRSCRDGQYKINTLAHYNVPEQASVYLKRKEEFHPNFLNPDLTRSTKTLMSDDLETRTLKGNTFLRNTPYGNNTLQSGVSNYSSINRLGSIPSASVIGTPLLSSAADHTQLQPYHIVKNDESQLSGTQQSRRKHHQSDKKIVHEVFLNYLLTTKTFLNEPIDEFMEAIFSTTYRGSGLPRCIKYMFDFFDRQAIKYGFVEPEIVHTWKSNALPLRFWVQLVNNPHIIFDIPPNQRAVEGCLNVISGALMDSCSFTDNSMTKDSPPSKLIFYKDMKKYRQRVARYYQEIHRRPAIAEEEMTQLLQEHSRQHDNIFNISRALIELYFNYIDEYFTEIHSRLESDQNAQMLNLGHKLSLVKHHLTNSNIRSNGSVNC